MTLLGHDDAPEPPEPWSVLVERAQLTRVTVPPPRARGDVYDGATSTDPLPTAPGRYRRQFMSATWCPVHPRPGTRHRPDHPRPARRRRAAMNRPACQACAPEHQTPATTRVGWGTGQRLQLCEPHAAAAQGHLGAQHGTPTRDQLLRQVRD